MRLKFWRRSRGPKKGVGTRRLKYNCDQKRLSGKCGVRSMENGECGKRGVWKMRSVEDKSLQNGKLNNDISPLFFDISSLIRHIH